MKEMFIAIGIALAVVAGAMFATAHMSKAHAGTVYTDPVIYNSATPRALNGYGDAPAERVRVLVPPFMMIQA